MYSYAGIYSSFRPTGEACACPYSSNCLVCIFAYVVAVFSTGVVYSCAYVVCCFPTGMVCACAYVIYWCCARSLAKESSDACGSGRVGLGRAVPRLWQWWRHNLESGISPACKLGWTAPPFLLKTGVKSPE